MTTTDQGITCKHGLPHGHPCSQCGAEAIASRTFPQHKDLLDAGYAPGNYTFKCMDCGCEAVGDKRARRCQPCAQKRVLSGTHSPTSNEQDCGHTKLYADSLQGPERFEPCPFCVRDDLLSVVERLTRELEPKEGGYVYGRAAYEQLSRAYTKRATAHQECEAKRDRLRAALDLRNTALRLIKSGPPLRMANDAVASWAAFIASEALSAEPADSAPETPKSSRDADHCDYPDCLQHNELVVERLRSKLDLIGRLSAHQPVVLAIQLAREALSDAPDYAPETSGGWRPIETAPKSRSDAGRDRHYVLVVYPGYRDGKPDPFVLMAYQDSLGWDTGSWRLHETPTHWMPLPELPSKATGEPI